MSCAMAGATLTYLIAKYSNYWAKFAPNSIPPAMEAGKGTENHLLPRAKRMGEELGVGIKK